MNKLYTIRQVADTLGCHPNKVRELCKSGKLKGFKLGKNGKDASRLHWRVKDIDLQDFIDGGAQDDNNH